MLLGLRGSVPNRTYALSRPPLSTLGAFTPSDSKFSTPNKSDAESIVQINRKALTCQRQLIESVKFQQYVY